MNLFTVNNVIIKRSLGDKETVNKETNPQIHQKFNYANS